MVPDNIGNYWNTGTPWLAVNFDFERRIAMFPTAFISWEDVAGAVGYNILWGLTSDQGDKLYQCYQVFADQRPTLELRALNIDQPYSFAIEAFNERGVSKAGKVVKVGVR